MIALFKTKESPVKTALYSVIEWDLNLKLLGNILSVYNTYGLTHNVSFRDIRFPWVELGVVKQFG